MTTINGEFEIMVKNMHNLWGLYNFLETCGRIYMLYYSLWEIFCLLTYANHFLLKVKQENVYYSGFLSLINIKSSRKGVIRIFGFPQKLQIKNWFCTNFHIIMIDFQPKFVNIVRYNWKCYTESNINGFVNV